MNVLVLAPHPDDEVIGCGGAVIKHILKGDKVCVLFITSGEAGNREENPENLMRVRESEAQQASEILGVSEVDFLHQPDGYLAYNSELLNLLTAKIRAASPDMVYLPHSADAHPDHVVVYQAGMEAINRAGGNGFPLVAGKPWSVKHILGYEVWTPMSHFQTVVDVSEVMAQKLAALRVYASQLNSVEYDAATEGLNRYRGAMTQTARFAEVFQVLKVSSDLWYGQDAE